MSLSKKLILVIVISSFLMGCCHSGVGFIDKPLKPEWLDVVFVKQDPDCEVDCFFIISQDSFINYNINNDNNDSLLRTYDKRIDECNVRLGYD